MVYNIGNNFADYNRCLDIHYKNNIGDEFVNPSIITKGCTIKDNDGILFVDFRPELMEELISVIENIDDMTSANAEKIVMDWIASKEYHLGAVMNAFRLAVVGACRGPHMFDITELMPKSEVIARVRRAIDTINK